jgi:hypothetical protein
MTIAKKEGVHLEAENNLREAMTRLSKMELLRSHKEDMTRETEEWKGQPQVSSTSRRCCLHLHAAAIVIAVLPPLSMPRRRHRHCPATAIVVIAAMLPSSLPCRRRPHCCAAAIVIAVLLPLSLPRRRPCHCFAATVVIIALLPLSLPHHHNCCHRHTATNFIIAPPLLSSPRYRHRHHEVLLPPASSPRHRNCCVKMGSHFFPQV